MNDTKKEVIQEDLQQDKIYPVTIELSENFLKTNPTIKELYKDGKLNMKLSANIEEDFAENLTSIIGDLNPREIVLFNPLVEAVNNIAELNSTIGTAKPEREKDDDDAAYSKKLKAWDKENDVVLKSINSQIRSFNGSLTNSKKSIKEPYSSVIRKIDALYNSFKNFSDKTKTKVESNFEELLTWRKEEADRIAAEQKAIADENIKNLEQKNIEANEKLVVSEKKNVFADVLLEIAEYHSNLEERLKSSNEKGIDLIEQEFRDKVFSWDIEDFDESKKSVITNNVEVFGASVWALIKKLREPKHVDPAQEVPEPTVIPEAAPAVEPLDDSGVFSAAIFRLGVVHDQAKLVKFDFKDHRLKSYGDKMNNQIELLTENITKLKELVQKKNDTYINLKK